MTRLIRAVSLFGAFVAIALLVFITLGITANIISRTFLGSSIVWMIQAVQYALIGVTFSGTAWVLLQDRHTRLDVLLFAVPKRTADRLIFISDIFGFVVMSTMTWYSVVAIVRAFGSGVIIYEYIVIPEWYLFTILPFGFGMMALVFLLRIFKREGLNTGSGTMPAR